MQNEKDVHSDLTGRLMRVALRAVTANDNPIAALSKGDLEQATRLSGAAGSYRASVSPAWEIWGPNGGYMASLALRAAMAESRIGVPATLHCHFLRPARFDWIDASVSVVQSGRRSESIRVSLTQQGKPVLEAIVRTALPGDGLEHTVSAPRVPAPEALPCAEELRRPEHPRYAFWENLETRVLQPERFAATPASLPTRWLEWYRFRPRPVFDDAVVDACRALVLIDTLCWPAAWLKHPQTTVRGLSLDVTVHFHGPTQRSAWLLCESTSAIASGGLVHGHVRVYGREGELLASGGSQLLCVTEAG